MAGMEITGHHEETPGWPFSMEGKREESTSCVFFSVFFVCLFFYFFWPCHVACRILAPQGPGIEPKPSAVKVRSPNHWTAREFPAPPVS